MLGVETVLVIVSSLAVTVSVVLAETAVTPLNRPLKLE
jgi:hypothetical protein